MSKEKCFNALGLDEQVGAYKVGGGRETPGIEKYMNEGVEL